MASKKDFVLYVVDQIDYPGEITFKHMFGEYGIYADGTLFGLICDNQLFVKQTNAGREYIDDPVEAPPYPGAKMQFLIDEKLEDREWLSELVRKTVAELPPPKPRKKKTRKKS